MKTATAEPPAATEGKGALWYRERRGQRWGLVSTHANEREAWGAIEASGKKNGDWTVLPHDQEP